MYLLLLGFGPGTFSPWSSPGSDAAQLVGADTDIYQNKKFVQKVQILCVNWPQFSKSDAT